AGALPRAGAASPAQPLRAARPGNHLPGLPAQGPYPPLRQWQRPGRRPAPLPRRPAHPPASSGVLGAVGEVAPPPPGRAAQDVAREALALADLRDDPHPDPAQKEEIDDSSYELLVVLSLAISAPQPGQSTQERHERVSEALEILDRTEWLHGPTRTYHLG